MEVAPAQTSPRIWLSFHNGTSPFSKYGGGTDAERVINVYAATFFLWLPPGDLIIAYARNIYL
eukprot:6449065-Karenia_brevis.AAC.1